MTPSSQTSLVSDEERAAEVAEQEAIAKDLVETTPKIAGSPAGDESPAEDSPVEEAPEVTLAPAADVEIDYPLVVSLANTEDITFEDENSYVDVPPEVAEQVTYLTNVEVIS